MISSAYSRAHSYESIQSDLSSQLQDTAWDTRHNHICRATPTSRRWRWLRHQQPLALRSVLSFGFATSTSGVALRAPAFPNFLARVALSYAHLGDSRNRLNESLKVLHDLNDEVGIVGERWRYAEMVRQIPFIDEYPSGQLSMLFEVLPSRKINDVWRSLDARDCYTLTRLAILVYHHNAFNIAARQNGDKQPMFVDVVQNVYRPNGVIPSAIRAYLVKEEVA